MEGSDAAATLRKRGDNRISDQSYGRSCNYGRVKTGLHSSRWMFTFDEPLNVNGVNSSFMKREQPRWRMKEVCFSSDESSTVNFVNETCYCKFLRREQGKFLLFAVRFPFLLFCLKTFYCSFETEGRPRTIGVRFYDRP
jgi:hypothetical protein